jgi:penicillin-binding protein 1C
MADFDASAGVVPAGTESPVVSAASVHAHFRISYPAAGTVIALIGHSQGFAEGLFEADGWVRSRGLLDGEPAGSADSLVLWSPLKGKHRLALVDRTDRILDSVEFEVRGNPVQVSEK